jgi:hypothetical protein
MKSFKILPTAAVAVAIAALVISGCGKERARRITAPTTTLRVEDFKDARWITSPEELRQATAGAAKSPLMARAVLDQASDPRLSLLAGGVISALGTAPDGSVVRMTLLPYQYSDDPDHAMYFALLDSGGKTRVESFEMFRNRKPTPSEAEFERVNGGDHGLWLRNGPVYVQTPSGIARMAPEKFNWQKFAWCFMPLADKLIGAVEDGCGSMGNFPGCVSMGSGMALAGAAIYCAFVSWNG